MIAIRRALAGLVLTLATSLPAQAALFFEIQRLGDQSFRIIASGSLDVGLTNTGGLFLSAISLQTNDGPGSYTGNVALGGYVFPSLTPSGLFGMSFSIEDAVVFSAGDQASGSGLFEKTDEDFLVAPVGEIGNLIAASDFAPDVVVGTYEVTAAVPLPAPAFLLLGGLAGLALLRRRV